MVFIVLIDKLLQMDIKTMSAMPMGEVEIKRLSEKIGEPFKIQVRGLQIKKYHDMVEFHSEEVEVEQYNEQKKKWQKVKEKRVKDETGTDQQVQAAAGSASASGHL